MTTMLSRNHVVRLQIHQLSMTLYGVQLYRALMTVSQTRHDPHGLYSSQLYYVYVPSVPSPFPDLQTALEWHGHESR